MLYFYISFRLFYSCILYLIGYLSGEKMRMIRIISSGKEKNLILKWSWKSYKVLFNVIEKQWKKSILLPLVKGLDAFFAISSGYFDWNRKTDLFFEIKYKDGRYVMEIYSGIDKPKNWE